MRPQVCLGLALSSRLGGLVVSVAKTTCIASLSYCGPNILNQFFCDVSPLLNLSCTHVALTELVDFISAIVIFCGFYSKKSDKFFSQKHMCQNI
jgi:olfactory receptor